MKKKPNEKAPPMGYLRSQLEAKNESVELCSLCNSTYSYVHLRQNKVVICWCINRYNWIMRRLLQMGVNVGCFHAANKEITAEKCLEISAALERLSREDYPSFGLYRDRSMLQQESEFFRLCGGIIIKEWLRDYAR